MKKVCSFLFVCVFCCFGCLGLFSGCDVGMGESVDLEAPEIYLKSMTSGDTAVENLSGGVYCKKQVTFSGTAQDNKGVSRVYVERKWASEENYSFIGNAELSGSDWNFTINFEKEGSCYVRFVAEDEAKNYSSKSSKTVTLFIDESAPVATAWYIDRNLNGIQYNLKSKEELESLDLSLPENKDAAQNVGFTLCANATDTYGIKAISVTIKDEDGNFVAKVENSNSENNYAPKFKVTDDILVQGNPKLASGKHYLQVFYNAEDVVDFPSSNSAEEIELELGWFIWWQESDVPRILVTSSELQTDSESGELTLNEHINNVIKLTFFDDDILSEGYFVLLSGTESEKLASGKTNEELWNEIKENPQILIDSVDDSSDSGAKTKRAVHFKADKEREKDIVLTTSSVAQTMKLFAIGWDNSSGISGGNSNVPGGEYNSSSENGNASVVSDKKIVTAEISVRVTDDSTPILLITSPKNNSVPVLNENKKITIEGEALDSAGCSYLEFVWVPSSLDKNLAKLWLDSIVTDSSHDALSKAKDRVSEKDGLKLWSVPLVEKGKTNGFYTSSFSFELDLLNDFTFNAGNAGNAGNGNGNAGNENGNEGGEINEKALDKYFLVKVTRKDGKSLYQDYSLSKDDLPPTIFSVSPLSDMQIVQEESDVSLKFYAEKVSGLEIETSSYRIERVDLSPAEEITSSVSGYSDVGYNKKSGYYEATIKSDLLKNLNGSGIKPKYRFYAKDIFGNENFAEYTLVISDLPALKSISSVASNKYKKGEKIDIVATFSKTVQIANDSSGSSSGGISSVSRPRLKLKGIRNTSGGKNISENDAVYAEYSSGSGTTSIHFVYAVQDGDISDGLRLFDSFPLDDNNSGSFAGDKVVIGALSDESSASGTESSGTGFSGATNSFDSKNIQIDAVSPSGKIAISASGGTKDEDGKTYLKEGSSITATISLDENVIVESPSPSVSFVLDGDESKKLSLPFTNISGSGKNTKLIFSRTISFASSTSSSSGSGGNQNGLLYYSLSSCVENSSSVKDSFGNTMELSAESSASSALPSVSSDFVNSNIYIDTIAPKTPKVTLASSSSAGSSIDELSDGAKFKDSVSFRIEKSEDDETLKELRYSVDGGSNWKSVESGISESGGIVRLDSSCSFTYCAVDKAGNISDISEPIYLDIESSFPSFSVECTNADGNYKLGSVINLRVSFDRAVNVPEGASATISISCADSSGTNASGTNSASAARIATLSSSSAKNVYSLDFSYKVTDSDDFTLKIEKDAVNLSGITDEYGIEQGSKTLSEDYVRSDIHCDGISPSVTGRELNGNVITLTFSENVMKSGGNIILRRAGNWAIPPVLTASEFNKIVNAYPSGKETLSLQENGKDMEDSEWVNGSSDNHKNQYYHGTGQFVGPYKKTTQGILENGEPDITTKYVLDFDMGIWETDEAHYYGKTFVSSTQKEPTTLTSANSKVRTANQIREVLKNAGYDKRTVDVTSSYVSVNGNIVTVTFPKGLCDESDDLPKGIEWELEIPENAFMDESGNDFDSYKSDSFFSSGVSSPVVRVDRYSYGLGIYQGTESGGESIVSDDSTMPTGYVRTRIDCETPDATIKYADIDSSGTESSDSVKIYVHSTDAPYIWVWQDGGKETSKEMWGTWDSQKKLGLATDLTDNTNWYVLEIGSKYYTKGKPFKFILNKGSTTITTSFSDSFFVYKDSQEVVSCYQENPLVSKSVLSGKTLSNTYSKTFSVGNGDFKTACKKYIVAQASRYDLGTSENGYEGIFQTVVRFVVPTQKGGTKLSDLGQNDDFSIRGTTGWSGEPYISPFPLRDAQNGSPYLRICYKNGTDYYWLSYETLVNTSFSGHGYGSGQWSYATGWGFVTCGGLSECSSMKLEY